jgi:hypothetical protein
MHRSLGRLTNGRRGAEGCTEQNRGGHSGRIRTRLIRLDHGFGLDLGRKHGADHRHGPGFGLGLGLDLRRDLWLRLGLDLRRNLRLRLRLRLGLDRRRDRRASRDGGLIRGEERRQLLPRGLGGPDGRPRAELRRASEEVVEGCRPMIGALVFGRGEVRVGGVLRAVGVGFVDSRFHPASFASWQGAWTAYPVSALRRRSASKMRAGRDAGPPGQ